MVSLGQEGVCTWVKVSSQTEIKSGSGLGMRLGTFQQMPEPFSGCFLDQVVILVLQVDSTYPELADLLLVVMKTLLSKPCVFEADKGNIFIHCTLS